MSSIIHQYLHSFYYSLHFLFVVQQVTGFINRLFLLLRVLHCPIEQVKKALQCGEIVLLSHRSRSGASVPASDFKQNAITHYSGLGGFPGDLEADPGSFGGYHAEQCPGLAVEPELLLGRPVLQDHAPEGGRLDTQDFQQQE